MNLHTYFPHLLSHLGEIQNKGTEHSVTNGSGSSPEGPL
jgi:hypothetical protein